MYGADLFAIRVGNKIVAEERGGMYLISLLVHHSRIDMPKEIEHTYAEQVDRFKTKPKLFTTFSSLDEYRTRGKADVLFYSTPKRLFIMKNDGRMESIRESIRKQKVRDKEFKGNETAILYNPYR